MGNEYETPQPIRQSVHVDSPVEDAFRLFTEGFREWWPADDSARNAVDRGSVTVWDPPEHIEFAWDPGDRQTVTVDFRVEGEGTRVTLTHSGWQHAAIASCASRFARFVSEQMLVAV